MPRIEHLSSGKRVVVSANVNGGSNPISVEEESGADTSTAGALRGSNRGHGVHGDGGLGLEKRDFLRLVEGQFRSSDFDAEHPVFLWLVKRYGLGLREGLWLSTLYMAFYDEASAICVFHRSDPFTVPRNIEYPIDKNRRNLFGGKVRAHFESLAAICRRYPDWPTHNFVGEPRRDWVILLGNLKEVWGNGRFACYTTAEMYQKVNGLVVEITGFDNKDSSGPADGIARLYRCSRDIETLDRFGEEAFNLVASSGLKPTYVGVDRGVVESVLCNYSGTCRGKFYSGRNLDRQQARIIRVEGMGEGLPKVLWMARKAVYPHSDLGELRGWVGIDKDRLRSYKDTGAMLWACEGR